MAPFNLEKNIREKMENRELKPSPDAWKKLQAQLDENQPKKKSRGWYYLAASVVGILIISTVFLNQNTVEVDTKIVKENVQGKGKENGEIIEMNTEVVSEFSNPSKEKNPSEGSKTEKQPKQTIKNSKPIPPKKESAIDKKLKRSEALANSPKEINPILKDNEIFNTKVEEVVASVQSLQNKNEEVTAEEVEALLSKARRDIQTQRILNNPKVDATALLQEVEWELEKSFRDKVFDALGEGFQKIRTAISQRND